MNRAVIVMLLAIVLSGCVSPAGSSGVATPSPGIFAVSRQSVPHFYNMSLLRAQARTDAVVHCKSLNKTMRVVDEKAAEPAAGSDERRRFDLTFACD